MKKTFGYTRISNSGNPYKVHFTVEVFPSGFVSIDAEFSLRETLNGCTDELCEFIKFAMTEYRLGVAEFDNRVNRGHPVHPINSGGRYYTVDGKMYRCDKHLSWGWKAPVSDLFRLLIALKQGKESNKELDI